MLYTEDLKTKLFKDKNGKKYTPASLYYGDKKTGGYSILEPSQKEIEIFNGYNDSAFIKINGESNQAGTPSPESPVNINSVENFDLITRKNNLISNGNFENGTTDFTNFGGFGLSAVDNVLTATGNASVVAGTIGQTTSFPIILNKKIFFRCKIKTKHSFTSLETLLRGSTSGTAGTVVIKTLSSPTTDTEYIVYGIGTVGASLTGDIRISIRAYGAGGTILDKAFETKEWFAVDMGVSDFDVLYNKTADDINAMYPNWDDKESKTINFPYTLRSLDGTADYIEIDNINKTAKLYNNVGNFVLTENIGFTAYTYNTLLGVYSSVLTDLIGKYTRAKGVCSHENRVGTFFTNTGTYMWIGINNSRIYWVGILDWLGFTTIEEFNTWLGEQAASGNTVTCIYKLETPTVTNLDYDEVTTYYPYTKIYTNATVQPTLDGKIRVQD